ncbi:MAG TPA: type II restriction endonuclease, partial [Cyanothece sp. UBA12306]|nr:type II restriction endonuclease [Cyanothece sp. UBA12306]
QQGLPDETALKLSEWDLYNQNLSANFFDPEWMFGVDSFDICLGNPPYVRQEKIKDLKPTLKQQYTCYTGVADLYVYFFEKGIKLLRENGILAYITSNKYFRSGYGKKLRELLTKQTQLQQLIDFGDAPVFTAIAYPSIIITVTQASSLSNKSNHYDYANLKALNWQIGKPIDNFIDVFNQDNFEVEQKALNPEGWQLEDKTILQLLDKLRNSGTPLGDYVNGRFYYGIKTGFNQAFIVDRETGDKLINEHPSSEEVLKPMVRGRDVKRWVVNFAEQYLIKIESSENKQHPWSNKPEKEAEKIFSQTHPAIYKHLNHYRENLIKRYDQGKYFWELRSCQYYSDIESPKIIYPDIAPSAYFAYDSNKIYTEATLFFIPDATLYLLGILNSRTFNYFFEQVSPKIRGDFLRYKKIYLSQIPIPKTTDTQDACVTEMVNKILEIKRQNPKADTTELERKIDEIVYELYGLNEEEIDIIEESVKR